MLTQFGRLLVGGSNAGLAAYQVVAGALGLLTVLQLVGPFLRATEQANRTFLYFSLCVMIAAFGLVALSGVLLLLRNKWSVPVTRLTLIAQVVSVGFAGYQYHFVAGALATPIVTEQGAFVDLGWETTMLLSSRDAPTSFYVNLVPVALLAVLKSLKIQPRGEA